MKLDLDFAYAQARIQARFATLPQEADWERLAVPRTLASFLEEARIWSLRAWVKGFSGQSDVHDLEAGLRALYWENLEAVAAWVPPRWCEAVSWVWWLMQLPLLAHLRAGGSVPGWVARDPALQGMLGPEGQLNIGFLEDAGARCLLESEDGPVTTWNRAWRRRWPPCSRAATQGLEGLTSLLTAHFDAFHQVAPDSAWRLREDLRRRLRRLFHGHALQPAIPFIYLALMSLDLERLRAALVSRVLFSEHAEPPWSQSVGRGTS